MRFSKRGLVFKTNNAPEWMQGGAIVPTPLVLADRIRIFLGFRDYTGKSRIGFCDVDKENPHKILGVSEEPVLDIGKPGMFDENGVVPTCVLQEGGKVFLYYAGYSLGYNVRFQVFTGLAVCEDSSLERFARIQEYPVTDRAGSAELFRVIHSVLKVDTTYKVWYGAGNRFLQGRRKTLPVYDVRYMESNSKSSFPSSGKIVIDIPKGCHRVGRPYVVHESGLYKMFYGYGSEAVPYQLAYAESLDGICWTQKEIGLELSDSGWDSQMMAYPAFVRTKNKAFLFYNGNDYGKEGFGYAELVEE
jgi:hypothetical protein